MLENNLVHVSNLLKSMSHPLRLKILCMLQEGEKSVGEIHQELKTSAANVSQHLAILRGRGIVASRKEANLIYNRIADERMSELIETLHKLFCADHK